MNFGRFILYFFHQRRRQKQKYFSLFVVVLIISSYIYYWWIEFSSEQDDHVQGQMETNDEVNVQTDEKMHLLRENLIISKYLNDPYKIDVLAIINEANRKYRMGSRLNEESRYLVYSCPFMCGGWGDRTRKIVAAFLLSLSLNRTFILDMTWPCSIEQILTSNLISWSISSHSHLRSLLSSVNLTSSSLKTYHDLKNVHQKYSVLYVQTTTIAYFDFIARRAELHQSLFTRFRIKREHIHIITLYPLLYELLIKLKSHLQERFDGLHLNENSTNGNIDHNRLLCGHLRIGRNPSNPKDVVFPHREKMNTTVLNFLRSRPGRIFITTDSGEVQQLARQLFGPKNNETYSRLVEINGTIAHIDRDWNYLACESLEKTILDFQALSYCHLAVISKSSFGHLAIMRRLEPYRNLYLFCNGIKRIKDADDYNQYKYLTC